MQVFDRARCAATATVRRGTVDRWRTCCATPPSGCWTGWTIPPAASRDALDVGGRGVVAPLLRARGIEVVSCDLSPAMAALNGGPCVAADEEFLPFAPGQLRPDRRQPVAALGQRPARRADPVAPGAAARRPAAGQPAGAGHAGGAARGADRGRGRADRRRLAARLAVSRTARLRRAAATRRLRAAGRRRGGDPAALCQPAGIARDLRAAGETNAVRLRDRRIPPRALFPAALAGLPVQDGRVAATLRMAVMTGWAPATQQ